MHLPQTDSTGPPEDSQGSGDIIKFALKKFMPFEMKGYSLSNEVMCYNEDIILDLFVECPESTAVDAAMTRCFISSASPSFAFLHLPCWWQERWRK